MVINQPKYSAQIHPQINDQHPNQQACNLQYPPPTYIRKTNTFSVKPTIPQLLTYIIITTETILYFIIIHLLLHNWILSIFYIITFIFMVISTLITCCTDPTDNIIYHYKWHIYNKQTKQQKSCQTNFQLQHFYCQNCSSFCGNNSKHCPYCDRCVHQFDHHCVWINNCIGRKNYRWFLCMTICTFVHFMVFIIGGSMATEYYNRNIQDLNIGQIFGRMIAVWIVMGILVILSIFLLCMIGFHFYLIWKDMTTYQFLIKRKQEQIKIIQKIKVKKQQKKQLQQITKIQNENNIIEQGQIQSKKNLDENIIFREESNLQSQDNDSDHVGTGIYQNNPQVVEENKESIQNNQRSKLAMFINNSYSRNKNNNQYKQKKVSKSLLLQVDIQLTDGSIFQEIKSMRDTIEKENCLNQQFQSFQQ